MGSDLLTVLVNQENQFCVGVDAELTDDDLDLVELLVIMTTSAVAMTMLSSVRLKHSWGMQLRAFVIYTGKHPGVQAWSP